MLHRRDFLAAAAAVVAASSLNAANTVRAFGVQLYTVAEAANRDLEGTLRRIAQIGYREIELGSLYGREPDAIRSLAEHFALRIPSVHVSAGAIGATGPLSLEGDLPRLAATVRAFGATHAVLSLAPLDELPRPRPGETFQAAISRLANAGGVAGWQRLAETLDTRGAALRREGVTLGYHNHNLEFLPLGDTCGWETLVAESDPGHLDFELDVGWVAAAGRDPVKLLRRHGARISQLHLKDIAATTRFNYVLQQDPATVGKGSIAWRALLAAARKAGVRHSYVEQEPPFIIDRFEAIARSFRYLHAIDGGGRP